MSSSLPSRSPCLRCGLLFGHSQSLHDFFASESLPLLALRAPIRSLPLLACLLRFRVVPLACAAGSYSVTPNPCMTSSLPSRSPCLRCGLLFGLSHSLHVFFASESFPLLALRAPIRSLPILACLLRVRVAPLACAAGSYSVSPNPCMSSSRPS